MIKLKLNSKLIPYLFGSYRFGIYLPETNPYVIRQQMKDDCYGVVQESPLFDVKFIKSSSNIEIPVFTLTSEGYEHIQQNFTDILTDHALLYIYLGIQRGDLVDVTHDIHKRKMSGLGGLHATVVEKGTYTVQSIDRSSVIISDDYNLSYRVRLYETRTMIHLREDQLEDNPEELNRRFPKIRLKTLVKRASAAIDALTLSEILDDLYKSPIFKNRIEESK